MVAQQDYMTAFNSNAKDLELLDGDVVKYVTTCYVYFKALRDKVARLYSTSELPNSASALSNGSGSRQESSEEALLDTIFIAFVTFESARYALTAMVDDRGRQDECVLAALLSELRAYVELLGHYREFKDEVNIARITGRKRSYDDLLSELRRREPPRLIGGKTLLTQIVTLWDAKSRRNGGWAEAS